MFRGIFLFSVTQIINWINNVFTIIYQGFLQNFILHQNDLQKYIKTKWILIKL